jgi:hypothetical protein
MTTRARALGVILALVSIALMGAGGVRASDSIGASIQSLVVIGESRDLTVLNRSTVVAQFTFLPSDGWSTSPPTIDLKPNEQRAVQVIGNGTDGSKITIHVTSLTSPAGSRSILEFTTKVLLARPFDLASAIPIALAVLVGLFVVLRVGIGLVRRVRRYSFKVERRAP